LVADEIGVVLEAAQQCRAQTCLVRTTVGRVHGVTIGRGEAVADKPGDSPFDRAMRAGPAGPAGKDIVDDAGLALDAALEKIAQAAGKVKGRLGRDIRGCEALVA